MTHHGTHEKAGHPEPNYMGVFLSLFVLTVVEIAVVFTPLSRFAIGGMLVLLAFTKAILVAAYFMHLKFENRTLALIAATPILLCIMLLFALLPDSDPKAPGRPAPAPPAVAAEH